jgi:hypothetical protein
MVVAPPGRYPMALVAERLDPYGAAHDMSHIVQGITQMPRSWAGRE